MCVFEDRAHDRTKLLLAISALEQASRRASVHVDRATVKTGHTVWPALLHYIFKTSVLIWKTLVEIEQIQIHIEYYFTIFHRLSKCAAPVARI